MRATFAPIALAALAAANPMPQGVTSAIAPQSTAPAGCKSTVDGTFLIELVKIGAKKREVVERDTEYLTLKLNGGILTDAKGRIGSIVANGQFQFDGPPAQEGAIYTAGWTLCPNNTLTLGAETVFYQCLTSTYYNIYDMSIGGQCSPVNIQAIDFNYAGSAPLSQISDGQPQASGAVTQYSDGQPQGPTGVPVSQYSDGQPQAPTGNPVSQYSDGQPQAPTGNPVSQYSDGQPQAPTGKPVSQISDGQPQAPTGKPVSQISDGQPQAPATSKPTGAPVSQISDGQPQAPTVTPSRASNATVAPTGAVTTSKPATTSPIAATGAAVAQGAGVVAVAAGVFAALLL